MTLQQALPFIVPLAILQLALMGVGLYDLTRPERRVRGGSKLVWALVIVFLNVLGPIVYLVAGRDEA